MVSDDDFDRLYKLPLALVQSFLHTAVFSWKEISNLIGLIAYRASKRGIFKITLLCSAHEERHCRQRRKKKMMLVSVVELPEPKRSSSWCCIYIKTRSNLVPKTLNHESKATTTWEGQTSGSRTNSDFLCFLSARTTFLRRQNTKIWRFDWI